MAVYKLGSRKVKEQQNPVRKERSPVAAVTIHNRPALATIDEGSEINCLSNLGVDILIGEPSKADNRISTIPHKKIIEVMGFDNKRIRLPYFSKIPSSTTYTTCSLCL